MDLQQEVEHIKEELIDIVIGHLRENKIDVARAKQLASDFLMLLPFKDQLDLVMKLKNLGEKYEEAKGIYVEELTKADNEHREQALNQMRDAIRIGNMDLAIAIAKEREQGV